MNILFWVLLLAPVMLFVASFIYYLKVQRYKPNSPYAWQAIVVASVLCWAAALYVHLWIIGKVA